MPVDHTASFGAWIKRLRAPLDLTQERLAEQVGRAVSVLFVLGVESATPPIAPARD